MNHNTYMGIKFEQVEVPIRGVCRNKLFEGILNLTTTSIKENSTSLFIYFPDKDWVGIEFESLESAIDFFDKGLQMMRKLKEKDN